MENIIDKPTTKVRERNSGFSEDELEYFKNIILDKRAEAVEEMEYLQASLLEMRDTDSDDASSTMHHMADVASDEQGRALQYQFIQRSRSFIGQLDRALKRIEDKSYGICRVTGNPIEKKRLEFAPHTRYSMEAKLKGLDKKMGSF